MKKQIIKTDQTQNKILVHLHSIVKLIVKSHLIIVTLISRIQRLFDKSHQRSGKLITKGPF
jgi:hypothetical protein